jgi:hypothetical protein
MAGILFKDFFNFLLLLGTIVEIHVLKNHSSSLVLLLMKDIESVCQQIEKFLSLKASQTFVLEDSQDKYEGENRKKRD